MKAKEIKTIEDIFNSEEFNLIFDIDSEKKEIETSGWNYNELINFSKELSKQL
jgi:hypothetical protein